MTDLARIKHLLGLSAEYEKRAGSEADSRKGDELRKLAHTYKEMALEIEKTARAMEIALTTPGVHRIDSGLYLQVKGAGRSWLHKYTFRGKQRWSGLGSADRATLAQARARRDEERALIQQGVDPVAERLR